MSIRSYKYRLKPTRAQAVALDEMLRDFCAFYNAGLQQRIEAYRRRGVNISFAQQSAEIKTCRSEDIEGIGRWPASGLTQVLRRLDQTYRAFFNRGRGFPRFRSLARFHSTRLRIGNGISLKKSGKFHIKGVPGEIAAVWHRDLPQSAKLGSATITRQQGKWHVILSVEHDFAETSGVGAIGVDLGLHSLIATSEGETIEAPQFARKAHREQRRRQRALARCKRGSRRRQKAKARLAAGSARIARQRRDHMHKVSRLLISRYQNIAFEDLNLIGLSKGRFARSIHGAAWSLLVQLVQYKAESAGAKVVLVGPRRTSQTCPSCGTIKAKTLTERRHRCDCGADVDRDVAAAMVVHQRAFGPGHGPRDLSQRNAA